MIKYFVNKNGQASPRIGKFIVLINRRNKIYDYETKKGYDRW